MLGPSRGCGGLVLLAPLFAEVAEGDAGGVGSAHAVDAAAGRSGRGAEVDAGRGGAVLVVGGAEEELAEVDGPTADVATDEVGVHGFEGGWGGDVAGEDAVAEAGGETLDLGLDAREHVFARAVGDVAVGPGDVLAGRGAGGIEEGRLGERTNGFSEVCPEDIAASEEAISARVPPMWTAEARRQLGAFQGMGRESA